MVVHIACNNSARVAMALVGVVAKLGEAVEDVAGTAIGEAAENLLEN